MLKQLWDGDIKRKVRVWIKVKVTCKERREMDRGIRVQMMSWSGLWGG